MHNLYIRVVDGVPVEHPLLADNVRYLLATSTLTDQIARDNGYYPYENINVPETSEITGIEGYEICEDEVVRPILNIREFSLEEKRDRFIRPQRDFYLAKSDWTQSLDSPLSDKKKAEWATYRQELRDITNTFSDAEKPEDVVWPEPPAK